ncbi:hypothetical protein E6H33_08530 [Candidatus Bathyarchaeota archaeon]|nr:MAG: hypothetical protein E6H33_08530 [Candidatus Bathyarchaeota archaeon]
MKTKEMKILLCVGVFVLLTAISPTFLSGARAIVQGPTATEFQVTINPTSTVTGQVYSSPQNPCCGAFWSVTAWIGRNGGQSSQPFDYFFTLQDDQSGTFVTAAQCGNSKNYDSGIGGYPSLVNACSMSEIVGGTMDLAYSITNNDPTYTRVYNVKAISSHT